jgi:hypothetical protein
MLHLLIGIYGILLIAIAVGIAGGVDRMQTDQRWVGVLVVAAIGILGVGMILDCITVVTKRNVFGIRSREAVLRSLYSLAPTQTRRSALRPPQIFERAVGGLMDAEALLSLSARVHRAGGWLSGVTFHQPGMRPDDRASNERDRAGQRQSRAGDHLHISFDGSAPDTRTV